MTDVNNNPEANSTASPSGSGASPAGSARLYEIGNLTTGVFEPVNRLGSGDVDGDMDADLIVHKESDGSEVVFKRNGQDENGNAIFTNPEFVIRDRETKLAPNGVTPVADIVVAPAAPEAPAAEGSEPAASVTPSENDAVYFSVYDTVGNFVRRYSSTENEGAENAEELANRFAAKIKGTVKRG